MAGQSFLLIAVISTFILIGEGQQKTKSICQKAFVCVHFGERVCGLNKFTKELRWFIDKCDVLEFNCEYKTIFLLICYILFTVSAHGPPRERDNEEVAVGRKMGTKWCSMAKVCNHDRMPVCGTNHAGDVMGFRDLCDMFDFNCIRRRNYKQINCPDDKSVLTASRRPSSSYWDD